MRSYIPGLDNLGLTSGPIETFAFISGLACGAGALIVFLLHQSLPPLHIMPFKSSVHLNQTGIKGPPPAWSQLKFNPVGLYSLRCHLGLIPQEPGIFQHYQQSFLAAEIAWFAAGLSEDNPSGKWLV
jgi:hypothetical protein